MTRAGAEMKRMRSMWDSIETHCWPVDKLAAIVISSKAYWQKDVVIDEQPTVPNARLTIEDVVDVTRAPPPEVTDKRGMRSEHYAIIGWSHKLPFYKKSHSPSTIRGNARMGTGYKGTNPHKHVAVQDGNKQVWFVLRKDGAVLLLNTIQGSVKHQLKIKEGDWND
jgi:hypothetical protein